MAIYEFKILKLFVILKLRFRTINNLVGTRLINHIILLSGSICRKRNGTFEIQFQFNLR